MTKTKTPPLPATLPPGIIASDLERPHWENKKERLVMTYAHDNEPPEAAVNSFELWFTTGMGWVIPTLHIANAGRRAQRAGITDERTYAATLDGKVARVGMGPHVQKRVIVWVRVNRLGALRPYLDLLAKGIEEAQQVRDRISTRRAQGALHRANGETSWRW